MNIIYIFQIKTIFICRFQSGLRDYAEYVMSRNKSSEQMLVFDPRTEEERIHADDLQALTAGGQEVPIYKPGTQLKNY